MKGYSLMTTERKRKQLVIDALKSGKTISEIGREIFHSTGTGSVNRFLDKYGIQVDKYNEAYRFMNPEWLKNAIEECGSPGKVAEKYNMSRTSVTRYAKRYELYNKKFTRTKTNTINEDYFDIIDTSNKAYWLGFIMADGNIYHYKDSNKIQFELKIQESDSELIEKFAKDIGFPLEKIYHRVRERKGTPTYSVGLRSYNERFCKNLIKHGIVDQKSVKETFPSLPAELKKDFVRGFWDGDGTVSGACSASSMSFEIISQLSIFFAERDIVSSVGCSIIQSGKTFYRISIPKKSLPDFKDLIYYDGCLGLKRKIECINDKIRSIRNNE